MDQLDNLIDKSEKSPWILAAMVILSNIGFKFIEKDLDEKKCSFLECGTSRKFIIFALIFCATKNFRVSILSTLAYAITVYFL